MNLKTNILITLISFVLLFPNFSFADRGMVVWPPDVYLDQSAQNAIIAWNGEEEIIILSADVEGSVKATALGILPLPSNPTEIKEGKFESFEKLVEIMNEKLEAIRQDFLGRGEEIKAPQAGIEITFHQKIGAHDVTVVKVNDLDYFLDWIEDFVKEKGLEAKQISSGFKEGVANYLKREIKYFVFDVIEVGKEKESIKPLIYRFNSDFLYYPLLISGISEIGESRARIDIFVITENEISDFPFSGVNFGWWGAGFTVELTKEELSQVNEEISQLFEGGVKVRKITYSGRLKEIEKDVLIYYPLWQRDLWVGNYGEDVGALQKILISEGVWDSEIGATGFFGPITREALTKFQEKYSQEILAPLGLKIGTGYFGQKTRDYLEKLSLKPVKEEVITWGRNLFLGMRGDDVKALQEILIKEGAWERPDVGATGYFGPITKKAVIKFQEKYFTEVLEPLGLEKGSGFVGPSTRAYLKKM